MRILVSLAGMVRLVALFFVLGIALGVYLGIGGGVDAGPPPAPDPVSVNATAP